MTVNVAPNVSLGAANALAALAAEAALLNISYAYFLTLKSVTLSSEPSTRRDDYGLLL